MYKLIKATEMNIELIKDIKLETIFSSPDEFGEGNEDKIKEYNINTAKIIRFIGRLTPYLY